MRLHPRRHACSVHAQFTRQFTQQLCDARLGIPKGSAPQHIPLPHRHIQFRFRHIDPHSSDGLGLWLSHGCFLLATLSLSCLENVLAFDLVHTRSATLDTIRTLSHAGQRDRNLSVWFLTKGCFGFTAAPPSVLGGISHHTRMLSKRSSVLYTQDNQTPCHSSICSAAQITRTTPPDD